MVIEYKVVGIDETRPPLIQPRPCIDLFFELNEVAPPIWCEEFQAGVGRQTFSIKIDPVIGLHVETWVRKPEQIKQSLDTVKSLVALANQAYSRRLKRDSRVVDSDDDTVTVVSPEQQSLNKLVAGLTFDD